VTVQEYADVTEFIVCVPDKVYVVVTLGYATYVPDLPTVPMLGESVGLPVAPGDVFQARVTGSPVAIDEGVAVMVQPVEG
jgi:hypothetical protein